MPTGKWAHDHMWRAALRGNVQPTAPQLTATSTEGAFSCRVDYFWIPRHPPTIQKLIWPSRRANVFRNLLMARLLSWKKLSNRPNTKMAPRHGGPVVRRFSHVLSCR